MIIITHYELPEICANRLDCTYDARGQFVKPVYIQVNHVSCSWRLNHAPVSTECTDWPAQHDMFKARDNVDFR